MSAIGRAEAVAQPAGTGPVARQAEAVRSLGRADGLALMFLAALLVPLTSLIWMRLPWAITDQGWFLQVAARVAAGEVLYRDVLWAYGPLPVLVFAWLSPLLNAGYLWLGLLQAAAPFLAQLMLYCTYRYFVSWRAALLLALVLMGTFSLPAFFVGCYTPGMLLGALACMAVLLGAAECLVGRARWFAAVLMAAGLAASLLSKVEYGLACLFLTLLALLLSLTICRGRSRALRTLTAGAGVGLLAAGAGYALVIAQAGWQNVAAGLRGYDQFASRSLLAFGFRPAYSQLLALAALVLLAGLLALVAAQGQKRKWLIGAGWAAAFLGAAAALALVIALKAGWLDGLQRGTLSPWRLPGLLWQYLLTNKRGVVLYGYDLAARATSLFLLLFALVLLPRWLRRWRKREQVTPEQVGCLLAVAYCILVDARYVLGGTDTLKMSAAVLVVPLAVSEFPRLWPGAWQRSRLLLLLLLGAVACLYFFNARQFYRTHNELANRLDTIHGPVWGSSAPIRDVGSIVDYVRSNSSPGAYIANFTWIDALGYLADRPNSFRPDYFMPGMGDGEQNGREIVERLQSRPPELIIVAQNSANWGILQMREGWDFVYRDGGLFQGATPAIESYVKEHYRLDRFLGGDWFEVAALKRVR